MKILVLSDIHANITALDAVLEAAGTVDAVWCLGDLVGYGADLDECVNRVRMLPQLLCIKGNHDLALSDDESLEIFNPEASEAIIASRKRISPENIAYLQELPDILTTNFATLVHGSPLDPYWEYILDVETAEENMAQVSTPLIFVGHSHMPLMFTKDDRMGKITRSFPSAEVKISLPGRAILNPGSVGQPRDNDPRASFGLFDPEEWTWEIRRVPYDIASVQARIRAAGMPERNALRLDAGW